MCDPSHSPQWAATIAAAASIAAASATSSSLLNDDDKDDDTSPLRRPPTGGAIAITANGEHTQRDAHSKREAAGRRHFGLLPAFVPRRFAPDRLWHPLPVRCPPNVGLASSIFPVSPVSPIRLAASRPSATAYTHVHVLGTCSARGAADNAHEVVEVMPPLTPLLPPRLLPRLLPWLLQLLSIPLAASLPPPPPPP